MGGDGVEVERVKRCSCNQSQPSDSHLSGYTAVAGEVQMGRGGQSATKLGSYQDESDIHIQPVKNPAPF